MFLPPDIKCAPKLILAPVIRKIARIYFDRETDERHQLYDSGWNERIDFDYCKKEALRILYLMRFIPAQKNKMNVCYEKTRTIIHVYYAAGGYD